MRNAKSNMANYGYGERDDMIGFIRDGKKMKFDELPTAAAQQDTYVPKAEREGNVGQWKMTQVITQDDEDVRKPEIEEEVKKEESPPPKPEIPHLGQSVREEKENKRERQKTPDAEDLIKFRVEEKTFPTDTRDEDEDIKVPVVGFKKRKFGAKNSRVSTVL